MKKQDLIRFVEQNYDRGSVEKFRSCSARVYDVPTSAGLGILLKSYETNVAFISAENVCYIFDYYSTTTAKHVAKFIQEYEPDEVVYLYKRSDRVFIRHFPRSLSQVECPTKKEFEALAAEDFDSIIENIYPV